ILVLGNAVLGVPYPRALGAFAGSYLLGALTLFALGLWLAAVAPNSRVVQGAGSAAMFPLLFFAGMWLPRRLMPEVLRRISDLTPTGALGQLFTDAFAGHPPEAFHLAVAAGWAVAAGLAAPRVFGCERRRACRDPGPGVRTPQESRTFATPVRDRKAAGRLTRSATIRTEQNRIFGPIFGEARCRRGCWSTRSMSPRIRRRSSTTSPHPRATWGCLPWWWPSGTSIAPTRTWSGIPRSSASPSARSATTTRSRSPCAPTGSPCTGRCAARAASGCATGSTCRLRTAGPGWRIGWS